MEREQPIEENKNITEVVSSLGRIISAVDLYGIEHSISVQAMEESFVLLQNALHEFKRVSFNVVDNHLLVNKKPLEGNNNFILRFIERLALLEVAGFVFSDGLSEDEFIKFILLLTVREPTSGSEDFNLALTNSGMGHISASKVVLRELGEDEEVVKKEKEDDKYDEQIIQQIVAFLKGDVDSPPDKLYDSAALENNVDMLTELILNSVSIQQRNPDLAGETVGDILVGCLRRTFGQMLRSPQAKTKTGRKKAAKSLLMIEHAIIDKLHKLAQAGDEKILEQHIVSCMSDMRDELKIDGLVADYAKKHKQLDNSEKELVKLLKNKDAEWIDDSGLKDKMQENGFVDNEWRRLTIKAGLSDAIDQPIEAGVSSTLEKVLNDFSRLLENVQQSEDKSELSLKISGAIKNIEEVVEDIFERVEEKSEELSRKLKKDKSLKKDWGLVQEIMQELLQPLSVICCTIEMLRDGQLGKLSDGAEDMLALAFESSVRMKKLSDYLIEICGVPAALIPADIEV